jgi:hypothetical protein
VHELAAVAIGAEASLLVILADIRLVVKPEGATAATG